MLTVEYHTLHQFVDTSHARFRMFFVCARARENTRACRGTVASLFHFLLYYLYRPAVAATPVSPGQKAYAGFPHGEVIQASTGASSGSHLGWMLSRYFLRVCGGGLDKGKQWVVDKE